MTTYLEHADLDYAENEVQRVQNLLEQWGMWARQGEVIKSPRTPLMGLHTTASKLAIDDDTAMAVDKAMVDCGRLYPKGAEALRLYYLRNHTNRIVAKKMDMREDTMARHKSNAIAYLVGRLSNF